MARDAAVYDTLGMRSLVLVLCLCVPAVANAGDSSWLWCKGIATRGATKTFFAASLLEHRASDGASRDLEVMLVYGAKAATTTLSKYDAGKPAKLATKGPVQFTGTAKLDEKMQTFTLDGKLDDTFGTAKPNMVAFSAKLTCETLDDLAIGH